MGNPLQRIVNTLWLISLTGSLASALNSQLALRWTAATYHDPDSIISLIISEWIGRTPFGLLIASAVAFSVGLACFTFAIFPGIVTPSIITALTALSGIALTTVGLCFLNEQIHWSVVVDNLLRETPQAFRPQRTRLSERKSRLGSRCQRCLRDCSKTKTADLEQSGHHTACAPRPFIFPSEPRVLPDEPQLDDMGTSRNPTEIGLAFNNIFYTEPYSLDFDTEYPGEVEHSFSPHGQLLAGIALTMFYREQEPHGWEMSRQLRIWKAEDPIEPIRIYPFPGLPTPISTVDIHWSSDSAYIHILLTEGREPWEYRGRERGRREYVLNVWPSYRVTIF